MPVFNVTASSRVGCIRANNEDMVLVGNQVIRDSEARMTFSDDDLNHLIIALADGMGGHSSGEVASADTIDNLKFYFGDLPVGMTEEMFMDSITNWHRSIHSIIDSKGCLEKRYARMGTTLVALACYEHHFYWMNCGDSRLYRLHAGELTQVTTDHSPLDPMGGHTNLINNCIGGGCQTSYIDIVPCDELVLPGDTLMLCSDGLNDMISDIEIRNLLNQGLDANDLCLAAEAAGGYDNVSVVVIRIE